jgi:hypothetical protein
MDSGLVDCGIEPGQRIWLTPMTAEQLRGCLLPEGVVFSFSYNEDKIMEPAAHEVLAEPHAPPAEVSAPSVENVAVPETAVTETAQAIDPPDAPPDLIGIAKATGGDSTLTIVLAVLAVVGGAASWKFWNKLSEQKHEQKMKEMDLDAKKAGLGAGQPPPCAAKQIETDAKLAEVTTRLAALEKKSASLSADFDGEDIERQVKKLQKTVKSLQEQSHAE